MDALREHQEFTPTTAIYRKDDEVGDLMYAALELADEAGEVAGKIKKYYRDGVIDIDAVAKEMGDVEYALSEIANLLDIDRATILKANIAKLKSRAERGVLSGSGDDR